MTSDLSADTEPPPAAGELKHPSASEPKVFKVTSGILVLRQAYSQMPLFFCKSCTFIT